MTETKSEGLRKEFKVVISAKDFEADVEKKIAQIAKTTKLPGFRPGKAPIVMLKQKYRASAIAEALDESVNNAVQDLVKKHKLNLAMMPDVKMGKFEEGKDIDLDVKVDLLPEIQLKDLTKLELVKQMAEVPAEEVEKTLKYLAQSRRETVKVEDRRALKTGDIAVIDYVGSVDGVEFKGGKGEAYPLELGSGSFIPGFEDQLVGAHAGDKVDVNVTFPKEYHAKDLAGQKAVFAVTVKELREKKDVEVNDDFAKSMGLENLAKVRENIASRIKSDYESAARAKLKRALLDVLDKEYDFEVPESLVEAEYKSILEQYEHAKAHGQLDEEEKSKPEKELFKDYKNIAVRRVKLGLLLSEVGKAAKITVTPDDINRAIMAEARRYPGQEKAVFDHFLKHKESIEALKAPIFEEKIVDYVLSQVKLNEKIVPVEELYRMDDALPAKKTAAKKETEKKEPAKKVKEKK